MKDPDVTGLPAHDQQRDDTDWMILDRIREIFEMTDPMPGDLTERIRFSLALQELEFEVAELSAEQDQRVPAARSAEQSRTVTFDSDSLTIMIRIDRNQDATARVDGWLAPAQQRTIELRTTTETLTAVADERGRFVFGQVPCGSAQLVVRAGSGGAFSGPAVVTPALIL